MVRGSKQLEEVGDCVRLAHPLQTQWRVQKYRERRKRAEGLIEKPLQNSEWHEQVSCDSFAFIENGIPFAFSMSYKYYLARLSGPSLYNVCIWKPLDSIVYICLWLSTCKTTLCTTLLSFSMDISVDPHGPNEQSCQRSSTASSKAKEETSQERF